MTCRTHLERPALRFSTSTDILDGLRQLSCGLWSDQHVSCACDVLLEVEKAGSSSRGTGCWARTLAGTASGSKSHMPAAKADIYTFADIERAVKADNGRILL
jgi:hypothetical protein